ncbi:MAG: hypothetical protein QOD07_1431 [Frankiaceae bacterium]|jgi:hypothetical protein|nr:hypothetical protein [Frankiaceae bacterium]
MSKNPAGPSRSDDPEAFLGSGAIEKGMVLDGASSIEPVDVPPSGVPQIQPTPITDQVSEPADE